MPLLFAQFEIAAPSRLLVLVLLPALVYLALRGRGGQPLWQKGASTGLRCAVFALLCVAWGAPAFRYPSGRKLIVFAVDNSASCGRQARTIAAEFDRQMASRKGVHEVRWMAFGDGVKLQASLPRPTNGGDDAYQAETDLAAAVQLARAACPPDRVPEVVLLTDGRATRGDALSAAAAESDTPISILPVKSFAEPEIAVDAISAPPQAAPGQSLEVAVTLRANHTDTVDARLTRNGELIAGRRLDVRSGETMWRVRTELGEATTTFQASIAGGRDSFPENNTLTTVVTRGKRPPVLVVAAESAAAGSLQDRLSKSGFAVENGSPEGFPANLAQIQQHRLIILADVAAGQFRPEQLAALDAYVRDGGGLIVTGGEATFGAAAYELTALERMLPVVATEQPVQQQKSLALVLIVDKSKSMEQENRLGLAKEAAKKVAQVLQPRDQVGVIAFGNESQWISRLAPLTDKDEVLRRIDQLQAEGLTNMYPAIQRAYLSLSQTDADSRHAILLTDGVPTPGDFGAVARRMAQADITVSTVSLGQGADQTILKDISRIARGNHYHVDDPDDLPKILERETRTAAGKVAEDEYPAQIYRRLPGLSIEGAPLLEGYVATSYKPGAHLLLTTGEGDPLLTWWRHGRGMAMVFTSDLAESARRWQSWAGYDAFWKRLADYATRALPPPSADLIVQQHNGRVRVTLEAAAGDAGETNSLTEGEATLTVTTLDRGLGDAETIAMPQVAPGRYAAEFDAAFGENLLLDAELVSRGTSIAKTQRGLAIGYPAEFRMRPTDEAKLQAIAAASGGTYDPQPEALFAPDGRTVDVRYPLWPHLLIAALLVFLADVAVRRIRSSTTDAQGFTRKRAA